MSDAAQVALVIGVVVIALAYMFLKLRSGKVDIGVKVPGASISASVTEGEKKAEVAEQMGLPLEVVEKISEPGKPEVSWKREKVANIYWLGSDLMHVFLNTQNGGQGTDIIRDLDHCVWHSEQLSLDPVITGRLASLLAQSKSYPDWDIPNRIHVMQELSALINFIGFIVEAADPNFIPKRPKLPPATGELTIIEGKWGSDAGKKDGWIDVIDTLKANTKQGRLKMVASIGNLGEPNQGVPKVLKVRYSVNGAVYDKEFKEDDAIELS